MSKQLWGIVQAHRDRYGPSVSEVAKRMGVGAQTLFNWRDRPLKDIPSPRILHELARVTETPYDAVFMAAAADAGYLDSHENDDTTAATPGASQPPERPPLDSGIPARRAHGPSRSGGRGAAGTSRDDTVSDS